MSGRAANALTVAGLLGLLAAVSLTAPQWAHFLRQPLATADEEPGAPAERRPTAPVEPAAEPQRKISVKLFFEAADRSGLVIEERVVPASSDFSRQLVSVLEELARGSESGLVSALGEAKVLDVFVTPRGVAYVDLSSEVAQNQPGGASAEMMTVYSVVNTVGVNFPAIKGVRILVNDRPVETLFGHMDLTRSLRPDLSLMAATPLAPIGEDAAEPSPPDSSPSPAAASPSPTPPVAAASVSPAPPSPKP